VELTFLHVAEYANTTADQKLNVMGIFNNINAANFPATHPEMFLVAQLTAQASEYGRQFQLGIKLLNEDATQEVINFSGPVIVPRGDNGLRVNMNFMIRFVNTVFNSPGTYEFSVLVDGDVKGSLPLQLSQIPAPPVQQ
jgi:hypothetical protein